MEEHEALGSRRSAYVVAGEHAVDELHGAQHGEVGEEGVQQLGALRRLVAVVGPELPGDVGQGGGGGLRGGGGGAGRGRGLR